MTVVVDLGKLRRELARQRLPELVRKYGRVRNGRVIRCTPGRGEIERDEWSPRGGPLAAGSDGKVIFDTRERAEAFAAELAAAGLPPLRAYECPRSRHGHHHLTRSKKQFP